LRDYCHLDERPVGQRIDDINVPTGDSELADARGHARAVIFRKDFCRSDERKSWRTAVLLFHGCPSRDSPGILYRVQPGGAQDWRRCSPALRLAVFLYKFSDEHGEFQVPFASASPRNGCARCLPKDCVEAAVFQRKSPSCWSEATWRARRCEPRLASLRKLRSSRDGPTERPGI